MGGVASKVQVFVAARDFQRSSSMPSVNAASNLTGTTIDSIYVACIRLRGFLARPFAVSNCYKVRGAEAKNAVPRGHRQRDRCFTQKRVINRFFSGARFLESLDQEVVC